MSSQVTLKKNSKSTVRFSPAKFQSMKTTLPVDMDLSATRIKKAPTRHFLRVKIKNPSLESSTTQKLKVIWERHSTTSLLRTFQKSGIKPKLTKYSVFLAISHQFSWTPTILVNTLLSATVVQTYKTANMGSLLLNKLSRKWTAKKSTASKFSVVQPKLKLNAKRRLLKSPKNTKTLKRDAIYSSRILHPRQPSRTSNPSLPSLVKLNLLKFQLRSTAALMHLYALKHQIQQHKLKPRESQLTTFL